MRVAVIGWEYPPQVAGGLGAACAGLTEGLAEAGHEVLLAVPARAEGAGAGVRDHPRIERIEISLDGASTGPGVTLAPYGPRVEADPSTQDRSQDRSPGRSLVSRRLYGRELDEALRRYAIGVVEALGGRDFDVIHAHDWMTIPAATRLRLATGRPFCLHLHSTSFDRSGAARVEGDPVRRLEEVGVRSADRVVTVSEYGRGVVAREFGALQEGIDVVLNGMEDGGVTAPEPPIDPERPVVLFLGRLTRQKGAGFLLRAVPAVLDRVPEARFVIAGEGEERRSLVEQAAALGVAQRVFFAGGLDDEERDRAYREAAVFVLPSVSEPFGLTPLEALRQGTPSVISSASGVREVLRSAPAPDPWDRAGLADAIATLLEEPERRAQLVERGRHEAQAATWDRSASQLESALRRTTQGAHRSTMLRRSR